MKRKFTLAMAAVALLSVAILSTGCQKLKARDELNKGVTAYKNAKYADAVEHFKLAVELDPEFPTARLYLAMSYFSQFIPGATSDDNMQMARSAEAEFKKVLEANPKDEVATESLASLYYNEAQGESSLDAKIQKLDVASQWYEKLIALNPSKKEAYYTLGYRLGKTCRAAWPGRARMKPDAPGPMKDKKKLEELRAKNLESVEKGIEALNKAINLDNEYDDAMAYINLLYRERADLQPTTELYEQDVEKADNWVEKSLSIKKIKAAREASKGGGGVVKEPTE
ncbi:MAG: hypothetical protein LC114_06665 [Bryobacterales bacterium]|nr:hypothetical protein [Bryobacterales bacterium]